MTPRTRRKRLPHLLDARKVALASFLDVDVKTIIAHPVRHDSIAKMNARFECTLGSKGDEFLVLIEKEAAEMTREEMDDVLWTLRPGISRGIYGRTFRRAHCKNSTGSWRGGQSRYRSSA